MSDEVDDAGVNAPLAIRRAAQEVITTQVVLKDRAQRDELIDSYVDAHGIEAVKCVVAFIHSNVADDVEPAVATDRFYFLLNRLGGVAELLAEIRGVEVGVVVQELAGTQYQYDAESGEAEGDVARQAVAAMQAAQTCLIANYFVRRGASPWGIQHTLDLEDMCAVVEMLGILLFDAVQLFESEAYARVVRLLLNDVEAILRAMAQARGLPVSEVVSDYFTGLARRDLG